LRSIPFLRDIAFEQSLDYPTVEVDIDREKAGLSGVTVQEVGNGVISATSSSRFIALNYWANPETGFDYQVEVLVLYFPGGCIHHAARASSLSAVA
jgi:multidrug efflux pump subunit AcrB